MYKVEIDHIYFTIQNLVFDNKMADAIEKLGVFIKSGHSFDQQGDYDNLVSDYRLMLEYLVKAVIDKDRQKVYDKLCCFLLEINDKTRQNAYFYCPELPQFKSKNYYSNQGKLTAESAHHIFEKIVTEREFEQLLKNTDIKNENSDAEGPLKQSLEDLFRLFWLTDKFDDAEIDLFWKIIKSDSFFWYEKSLLVSALTLGLLNTLDISKISMLIKTYQLKVPNVSERAFTGLMLSLYKYDKRLKYYPALEAELMLLADDKDIREDALVVFSQLSEAKDTEKLTKKIQDEIMPDVIRHAPGLMNKFNTEDLLSDFDENEKDPKWKSLLKETPELYDKFEELSKMQMKGSDMFMGTFAHLKHFPFFNNMTNWLLPYFSENTTLKNVLGEKTTESSGKDFLEAMQNNPYFCNSDKYSFCFNLKALPEHQRNMLTEVFIAEMNSMAEMMFEDGKVETGISKRYVTIQYIQDLYRFFKLNPHKNHFEDVFEWKLDFYNTRFFNLLFDGLGFINKIAEFYFEKENYEDALNLFLKLSEAGNNKLDILQKTAFCYQKLKNYNTAVEYYHKAELSEPGNIWTLKKLAYCHLKLNQVKEALNCYLEIEKLFPEDAMIQIKIGHCYFVLNDVETSLQHYFKAEFLLPDNIKVIRPLAWICLTQNRIDDAKRLYEKVAVQEINYIDYTNIGHIEWLLNNRPLAVEKYFQAILRNPAGFQGFKDIFMQDTEILSQSGYKKEEIPLLLDYLKTFSSESIARSDL